MSAPKLTPWFPADKKPARVGVYETTSSSSSSGEQIFQHWSGRFWGCCTMDPAIAVKLKYAAVQSVSQQHRWRGLAKEPQ